MGHDLDFVFGVVEVDIGTKWVDYLLSSNPTVGAIYDPLGAIHGSDYRCEGNTQVMAF